jgi:hypothetical protein
MSDTRTSTQRRPPARYRTKRAIRFAKTHGKTLRSDCRKLASMLAHVKGFRCANIAPERGLSMSGRPSGVRQHDVEKIVRGAMKAGAKRVDIHVGDARITVRADDDEKSVEADEEISL